jgi:DNA-directed RNA polymerase specialized sigma24 family protein
LAAGLSVRWFAFHMAKDNSVTEESFDVLLRWLDDNRELAGQKYEKIRRSLIWVFMGRGCSEAEEMADETIERVTRRMPQLADGYVGEPILYFFGVADKIHNEWLRNQRKLKQLRFREIDNQDETNKIEIEYDCLENCLATLPADQHRLVVEYYREEKAAKIENRRLLAENSGLTANGLQIKMFRIRMRLKECVENCIARKTLK